MGAIFGVVLLMGMLVVGPLAWLAWKDRKRAEADQVGAAVRWAVNRRLRGESLLSVQVAPRSFWRPGRVVLYAPTGSERLLEEVWPVVIEHIPAGYDFVVRLLRPRMSPRGGGAGEHSRAA